jgi:hypothetical protein
MNVQGAFDNQQTDRTTVATNTTSEEAHPVNNADPVDDLAMFVEFVSSTPSAPLLHTPPRVNDIQITQPNNSMQPYQQRKSNRLAEKAKANTVTGSIQMAQRVLMNKLGELSPDLTSKANDNFEQMAHHSARPLTKTTMEALKVAVEQGNKLLNKSKKKAKVAPSPAGVMA